MSSDAFRGVAITLARHPVIHQLTRPQPFRLFLAAVSQALWSMRRASSELQLRISRIKPPVRHMLNHLLTPLLKLTCYTVVKTDNSVTNDLFPDGARGLLGYGVDLPSGLGASASLLASFVPYVIFYLVPIVATDYHRSERMLPMQSAVLNSTIWTILSHRVFLRWVQLIQQRKHLHVPVG